MSKKYGVIWYEFICQPPKEIGLNDWILALFLADGLVTIHYTWSA
jgi:hypothetical protein